MKRQKATERTSTSLAELLPKVLERLEGQLEERGDVICATWPEVIGDKLKGMTEAVSFRNKALYIKVKNSTLYSLLTQHEKTRLLEVLRKRFPKVEIQNIVFLRQ